MNFMNVVFTAQKQVFTSWPPSQYSVICVWDTWAMFLVCLFANFSWPNPCRLLKWKKLVDFPRLSPSLTCIGRIRALWPTRSILTIPYANELYLSEKNKWNAPQHHFDSWSKENGATLSEFWSSIYIYRQASEIRPPMFRHLLHLSRFWRELICPMSFLFYVLPFRCSSPLSDFGDERVKSLGKCPVVVSQSVKLIAWMPCVSTHADVALITLPQCWLNALSVQGISKWLISK